jgi:hypothetical protein
LVSYYFWPIALSTGRTSHPEPEKQILACNEAKSSGDSWGVFSHCGKAADVPLPADCLASDDAARSPKCVAIARGEALSGAVDSTGQTAVTVGTLFAP